MFGLRDYDKLLVLLNLFIYFNINLCNSVQNNSFTAPQLRSGGWTPIPTNTKNFKQLETVERSASQPTATKVQQVEHKRAQDSEMLPIPVIKPHRHGATLGFDLPEQGLTLYLDINELATKPLAQNIGLKVVSHEPQQAQSNQTPTLNHFKPTQNLQSNQNTGSAVNNKIYSGNASPLHQFVSKMQAINNNSPPKSPITVAKIQKRVKPARNIGSYEGNAPLPVDNGGAPASVLKAQLQKPVNKYHVGYMRPHDLQNALKHVGMAHSENEAQAISGNNNNNNLNNIISKPSSGPRTVVINTHSLGNNNINYEKLFNSPQTEEKKESALDSFSHNSDKYFNRPITQVSQDGQTNLVRPSHNSAPQPASYQYSSLQMPIRPSVQYPVQEKERPDSQIPQRPTVEEPVQQTTQEEEVDNEVVRKTTTTAPPVLPPQQEDEQQKGFDDEIEQTTESVIGNRFEEPQRQISGDDSTEQLDMDKFKQTTISLPKPTTGAQLVPPTDDTIVKVFPGADTAQRQMSQQQNDLGDGISHSCSSQPQSCQQICDAKTDNLITEAGNIREIIHKLNADSLLSAFPTMEEELQNIIDFASSDGYTMILPSNEAISRLPPNLFQFWKNNVNSLTPLLDNHVIDSAQSLEDMRLAQIIQPRSGSKLRVQRGTQ